MVTEQCIMIDRAPMESTRSKRGRVDDPLIRISKEMSRVLRHHPPPGGMDAQGWVALSILIKHLKSRPTEAQVRQVVESNDKKRYVIDDSSEPPRIRATQGHSVQLEDPILQPVLDHSQLNLAIHVTSKEGWEAIQACGELRAMARTHIHFATEPEQLRGNKWVAVALRLDLQAALASGHAFGLSSNGVLLCEGPLPVRFVAELLPEDVNGLPEQWRQKLVSQLLTHNKQ
ncbi:hypothetical protein CEUSTIGMA_g12293.t1 [Chlamydomonas eustigma]|uniref:2'-phosphotransferase n=1 Tax=Chlamydomonas eustigma TaxID=1157962 RepID=A0A250XPL6_9CHLO|nr:hypothetical protein CEUSTIGMA_g12293.t1 [Chlamydomonas eustigma]|eukprot:GAX84872.1 hypothetical protein CEUSTIGMA_g12293.t1 [Chlamydomonas eustigma]